MITCPKCSRKHRGPRDLTQLRSEAAHVLVRADAMPMEQAAEYLRTQWMGGALELANHCRDCIVVALTVAMVQVEVVAQAEEAMQAAPGAPLPPLHLCRVIPLFPKRDLLDVAALFDSQRKE